MRELPKDQRKIIRWLNSKSGVKWSRSVHNGEVHWWYQFKRDQETFYSECEGAYYDDMNDVRTVELGYIDRAGRYHSAPRATHFIQYGHPVEDS